MMRAYHDAREAGVDVPKISGYLQMGSTLPNRWMLLKAVYFNLCYNEYYKDLWYYWDGKPLMIQNGYEGNIGAANQNDPEEVALAKEIVNFFTFRETGDRWKGATTQNKYWHWLVNYRSRVGYTESGRTECVNLGMAINESYLYGATKGRRIFRRLHQGQELHRSIRRGLPPRGDTPGIFLPRAGFARARHRPRILLRRRMERI